MATVDAIANQIRVLLPLEEENVEAFDELVGQLAGVGGSAGARELLLLLDDSCELAGVMEGLTVALQSLQPVDVAVALVVNLDDVLVRGQRHLRAVLRWLVSSEAGRDALVAAGHDLAADRKERLRGELREVGRSPKYADRCREVAAEL